MNSGRCKVSLCFAIYAWVGNFKFWGDYAMVTRCIVPALRRPCAHLTSYIRTLYTVVHSGWKGVFKSTNFDKKSNELQLLYIFIRTDSGL